MDRDGMLTWAVLDSGEMVVKEEARGLEMVEIAPA